MSVRAVRMGAFVALTLAGVMAAGCLPEEDHADLLGAYSEIGAAIDFKARECGHQPAYPLILPGKPSNYGTRLCSLTILRQACPFRDYPLFCLEMYTLECEACDLPLIGP